MKTIKLLILLTTILSLFFSCKRQAGCTDPSSVNYNPDAKKNSGNCIKPEAVKNAVLFSRTSIAKPSCYLYDTAIDNELNSNNYNCYKINIHRAGALKREIVNGRIGWLCKPYYPGTCPYASEYIPTYYVNKSRITNNSVGPMEKINSKTSTPPLGSVAGSLEIVDNIIKVNTSTVFYDEVANKPYHLGVFLLENNIPAVGEYAQVGNNNPDYKHNNVFRCSLNENDIGDNITDEPIQLNTPYFQEFECELSENWKAENVEIILILMELDGPETDQPFQAGYGNCYKNAQILNASKAVRL